MEQLLGKLAGFLFIILGIAIAIYIVTAIFLNKFNKLINGKGTVMAWIPILDIYLLGKLTVNKLVGWLLVICVFLTSNYFTTANGIVSSNSILPEGIRNVVSTIYCFSVLGLFIYAIIKYNKLKKEKLIDISQQTKQTSTQSSNSVIAEQQTVQEPIQNVNETMSSQQNSSVEDINNNK